MISEASVKIIKDICALITDAGGECSDWRVGTAADVERELYDIEGVARDYPWQIYRRALSSREALEIVEGFRNLSCEAVQRPEGNRDEPAVYVFAHLKSRQAKPAANGLGNGSMPPRRNETKSTHSFPP